MKTKLRVRAGGIYLNHNETLARDPARGQGLKVKTRVKSGALSINHNETLVRDKRHKG